MTMKSFLAITSLATLLAMAPTVARATDGNPPDRMTYQGFLVDGNGNAMALTAPKNYDVIFRLYNAQTGGTTLWGEQQTVTVDKGAFSVILGEGSVYNNEAHPVLSAVFTGVDASDRFVEMTVKGIGASGADVTIAPRLRLLTSPYAFLARSLGSATGKAMTVVGSNVAVNKDVPTSALDVNGTVTATGFLGNGLSRFTDLYAGGEYSSGGFTSLHLGVSVASGGYSFLQSVKSSGSSFGDLILNREGGNVGIGMANPVAKLDVSGNVNVNGAITVNGAVNANALSATGDINANGQVTSKGNLNSGLDVNVVNDVNCMGIVRMGPNRKYSATSSEETLKIVRGHVRNAVAGLSVLAGSGFSVTLVSAGTYLVTFTTPFTGMPVITASIADSNISGTTAVPVNVSATGFSVYTLNNGYRNEYNFTFIAVGPR